MEYAVSTSSGLMYSILVRLAREQRGQVRWYRVCLWVSDRSITMLQYRLVISPIILLLLSRMGKSRQVRQPAVPRQILKDLYRSPPYLPTRAPSTRHLLHRTVGPKMAHSRPLALRRFEPAYPLFRPFRIPTPVSVLVAMQIPRQVDPWASG